MHVIAKGSRKNKFTFFMVRSNSSKLAVEYIVSSLIDAFVGQRPSYLSVILDVKKTRIFNPVVVLVVRMNFNTVS